MHARLRNLQVGAIRKTSATSDSDAPRDSEPYITTSCLVRRPHPAARPGTVLEVHPREATQPQRRPGGQTERDDVQLPQRRRSRVGKERVQGVGEARARARRNRNRNGHGGGLRFEAEVRERGEVETRGGGGAARRRVRRSGAATGGAGAGGGWSRPRPRPLARGARRRASRGGGMRGAARRGARGPGTHVPGGRRATRPSGRAARCCSPRPASRAGHRLGCRVLSVPQV